MAKQINTVLSLKDKISQPLVKVSSNVDKVTREMKKSANQVEKWKTNSVKAIDNVIKKSLKLGAALTGAGLAYSIKTAIDLEDAFSGVRKTVDATEAEFSQLRGELNTLATEIPLTVKEIYEIGESAGQLGIAKENIAKFSDTMAKLGVATNMSSDEAATALARLANITGMPQTEFDKLGSTIVDLGNNLATTESEIVEMGLRLAGAGKQVGMTEAQILGLSGALSSVGIEAQAGGSAFSKVMIDMQLAVETGKGKLKDFAKISGMSTKDFQKAFKNDAASAITAFIEGLSKAEEKGTTAIKVLDDMGIKEVRLRDALLRASGASDLFNNSIELGTKAWEENTALQEEAEEKFKNTKSQLTLLKNNLTLAADELGQVFLPYINDAVNAATPFIQKLGESKESLKEVSENIIDLGVKIFDFVDRNQTLILSVAGFVGGMYGAIKVITTAKSVLTALNTAGLLLNGTLAMTPLGWVVIGIGAAIAAGIALYKNWDIVKVKAEKFGYVVANAFSNMGTGVSNVFKAIPNAFINLVMNPIIKLINKIPGVNLDLVKPFEYGSFKTIVMPSFGNSHETIVGNETISAYAKGTSYSPAGFARIHEEGGEIRKLSSGETIIPADKSERLLKNKSLSGDMKVEVKVYGNIYGDDEITDKVGNEVYKKVKLALDNI